MIMPFQCWIILTRLLLAHGHLRVELASLSLPISNVSIKAKQQQQPLWKKILDGLGVEVGDGGDEDGGDDDEDSYYDHDKSDADRKNWFPPSDST